MDMQTRIQPELQGICAIGNIAYGNNAVFSCWLQGPAAMHFL